MPMPFADFDRILPTSASEPPSPADMATCLADLAEGWHELDRRMDRIFDLLPRDIRKDMEGERSFDTFLAWRHMLVHAATMRGVADAALAGDPRCPYSALRRSEREAWTKAFAGARRLFGEAA